VIDALQLGKVVDVHPEHNSVDVRLLNDNRELVSVPVAGLALSGNTGVVDLPVMDLTTARSDPEKWDSGNTDRRDIMAVIAFYEGSPVCLGFLYPPLSEMNFAPALGEERRLWRHASDVYSWTDKNGDTQFVHPSGTFLSFGEARGFLDLTAKDYDKLWMLHRNTDRRPGLRLVIFNGKHSFLELDVDPDGNVKLRTDGWADIDVTKDVKLHVGGDVNATIDGDLAATIGGDATVEVGGSASLSAGADVTVVAGGDLSATAGGSATLTAPTITLTGDVVAIAAPVITLTGEIMHIGDMLTTGRHKDNIQAGSPGKHIP